MTRTFTQIRYNAMLATACFMLACGGPEMDVAADQGAQAQSEIISLNLPQGPSRAGAAAPADTPRSRFSLDPTTNVLTVSGTNASRGTRAMAAITRASSFVFSRIGFKHHNELIIIIIILLLF